MDQAGYVYLWRKIRNYRHWPGNNNKPYTKFEAWLDLIMAVEFKPTTKYYDGKQINLDRGEVIASYRYLGNRWKWSTSKVASFLDDLKTNTEIKTHETAGITVIKLLNYKELQTPTVFLGDKKKTPKKTEKRQQKDKVNEANKSNKDILDEIAPVAKDDYQTPKASLSFIPKGFYHYLDKKGIQQIDFYCSDDKKKMDMLQNYINKYGNN